MKRYTLGFQSKQLENLYRDANLSGNIRVFRTNMYYFFVIALTIALFAFYDDRIILATLASIYTAQIPLFYCLAKRNNVNFDIFIFAFQITLALSHSIVLIFDQVSGLLIGVESLIIGQAGAYIAIRYYELPYHDSQYIGSRFYLKVLSIIVNIAVQLFSKFGLNQECSTPLTIFWVGSNFMILNQDRLKREAFQTKHNEKLWLSELGTFAQVCIMSFDSERGQLQLNVKNCNKISQEQFMITDLDSYKIFLQSVITIPEKHFQEQIFNQKNKLKSKTNLFTQISRYSSSDFLESQLLVGLYNKCLYDIKIFTTWNEQILKINVLMTKSSLQIKNQESQSILFERTIFKDQGHKFVSKFKNILHQLQCYQDKNSNFGQLLCSLYDTMRINFNSQLFFNPSYKPNKSHFFLLPLMNILNTIVKRSMPNPHQVDIKFSVDPKLNLHTCQKTLFHILYNLYTIIISKAQQSGFIKLDTYQKETQVGIFIMFMITTDIKTIQVLTQNQYSNTQSGRRRLDFETFSNQQIGLELVVSEYLIGKIGPKRRIKFIQSLSERPLIIFKIFKDIQVMK